MGKFTWFTGTKITFTFKKTKAVIKSVKLDYNTKAEYEKQTLEYKLHCKLSHPNIVDCHGVYSSSSRKKMLKIVMEYCEKGDLSKVIDEYKQKGTFIPESVILNWFAQICLGLLHLHDRKIVHRDIKSLNIFRTADNVVKIGDFGISKKLKSTLEMCETQIGTPSYLSPEIICNEPYSYKTDVWSLGVLLYELCALELPFRATSYPAMVLKITKGEFDPIPEIYSDELRAIVDALLTYDPTNRPSVAEICDIRLIKSEIKKINESNFSLSRGESEKSTGSGGSGSFKFSKKASLSFQSAIKSRKEPENKEEMMNTMRKEGEERVSKLEDNEIAEDKPSVEDRLLVLEEKLREKYGTKFEELCSLIRDKTDGFATFKDSSRIENEFKGEFGKEALDEVFAYMVAVSAKENN